MPLIFFGFNFLEKKFYNACDLHFFPVYSSSRIIRGNTESNLFIAKVDDIVSDKIVVDILIRQLYNIYPETYFVFSNEIDDDKHRDDLTT